MTEPRRRLRVATLANLDLPLSRPKGLEDLAELLARGALRLLERELTSLPTGADMKPCKP